MSSPNQVVSVEEILGVVHDRAGVQNDDRTFHVRLRETLEQVKIDVVKDQNERHKADLSGKSVVGLEQTSGDQPESLPSRPDLHQRKHQNQSENERQNAQPNEKAFDVEDRKKVQVFVLSQVEFHLTIRDSVVN